jgi:hypothetical protein
LPRQLLEKWLAETAALLAREPSALLSHEAPRANLIAVKLLRPYRNLFTGEVAGFPLDEVERLVGSGYAEVVTS